LKCLRFSHTFHYFSCCSHCPGSCLTSPCLHATFSMIRLFSYPENGGSTFLRNIRLRCVTLPRTVILMDLSVFLSLIIVCEKFSVKWCCQLRHSMLLGNPQASHTNGW
jgi:hypothetical protein